MNPLLQKIQLLLAREPSGLARACEQILTSGSPALNSLELPLKNTRDIYYRRAELNAAHGHPIEGFDDLVNDLAAEKEPTIGIQGVTVGSRKFLLFTTPDLSRLIGILLFPPRVESVA